jgi:hypothetical protein
MGHTNNIIGIFEFKASSKKKILESKVETG